MNIQTRIKFRVDEVLHFFQNKHGKTYKFPKIHYFCHPEDVGMAYPEDWIIEFNTDYLASHPDMMIEEIIPHEVIHLIADTLQKPCESYHGRTWCKLMREFGLKPKAVYEFT